MCVCLEADGETEQFSFFFAFFLKGLIRSSSGFRFLGVSVCVNLLYVGVCTYAFVFTYTYVLVC